MLCIYLWHDDGVCVWCAEYCMYVFMDSWTCVLGWISGLVRCTYGAFGRDMALRTRGVLVSRAFFFSQLDLGIVLGVC